MQEELEWVSEYKGSKIISFLSRNTTLPWISMRAVFKLEINGKFCTKCGLCENLCPVSNIKLNEKPIHKNRCQFCMRCIASCPQKAIYIRGKENLTVKKFGDD